MAHQPVGVGPRTLPVDPAGEPSSFTRFSLDPRGVSIGADVGGVDLRRPCDDELLAQLERALRAWKVLFFTGQDLTRRELADFAVRWGRLTDDQLDASSSDDPIDNVVEFTRDARTAGLENGWHTDGTFRPMPTAGTMLRAVEVPPRGGDTLFADMAAAYDNLTPEIQRQVIGLHAVHDWSAGAYASKYQDSLERFRSSYPPVEHPVVISHPLTGRPTLFVNRLFTTAIVGLEPSAGARLLDLLCHQAEVPEFQCRLHWEPGTVAFWDNLAVQHYGANDYYPARRVMMRATFFDDRYSSLDPADG